MVEKWMRAGEDEQVSRTFSGRGRTLRAMTSLTSPLLRVISAAARASSQHVDSLL